MKSIQLSGEPEEGKNLIADHIIKELEEYEHKNLCKFIGAGLPYELMERSPTLYSRLWLELDIVPISFITQLERRETANDRIHWDAKCVDEQADSMARKCIM